MSIRDDLNEAENIHTPAAPETHYDDDPILPDDIDASAFAAAEHPQAKTATSSSKNNTSHTVNYAIVALLFLFVGAVLGMNLGGSDAEALEQVVRDTVREEMVVVLEGLGSMSVAGGAGIDAEQLEAMIARAVTDASNQKSLLIGDDPYFGPEDAPVVIVEFSDFLCSFCGRHFNETLTPILTNYDGLVRYVFRDFPSVGGQNAVEAGMAAHCANDQGKFREYHNTLFENQQQLYTNDLNQLRGLLIGFAGDLGMDEAAFAQCLDSDQYMSDILQDASEGQQNGVRGTPGFFVNGTFVSGAQPYETFASLIDSELRAKGIEIPGGGA